MKYAIPGYEDVTAEYLLGIFGNPIKHTLSPVIHHMLLVWHGNIQSKHAFVIRKLHTMRKLLVLHAEWHIPL